MPRLPIALALAAALLPVAPALAADELSHRLQIVADTGVTSGRDVGLSANGPGSLARRGDGFVAEARVAGPIWARAAALRDQAGAVVLHVSPEYDTVVVALERDELEAAAALDGILSVTESLTPDTGNVDAERIGAKTTEGDTQLRAALARSEFAVDGTGVEVGVLSDSYDTRTTGINASNDVASGDLPGVGNPNGHTTPVDVLEDFTDPDPGESTADEGRAMLQIVHDLAPGANLSFATAFGGELTFAGNIGDLVAAGADVIVDDVIYLGEPMFQDGPIANAVTDANAAGVPYFSMAFNNNQVDSAGRDIASWEAPAFRSGACPALVTADAQFPAGGTCMDFNPDPAVSDTTFGIGAIEDSTLKITLQWAEAWNAVSTDFELYLLNPGASQISAESHNVNATTQKPFEFAAISTTASTSQREVVIVRKPGAGTPRVKFVVSNNGAEISSFEYPSSSGGDVVGPSIFGHNGTAAAQSVGAISYLSTTQPEDFSSRGPVTHYFEPTDEGTDALASPEVLIKPDITATDRGANTFFGPNVGGTFRFSGTSAAAPHAAAVAALQLDKDPTLTPAQIKADQKSTAVAIGSFGFDAPGLNAVGAGLVDARDALGFSLAPPTATVTSPPALSQTASVTFSSNRRGTFTCAVDGGAATACTSPFALTGVPDGAHTVTVTAADLGGRTASATTSSFTLDATSPAAPTVAALQGTAIAFSSPEAGVAFSCSLDGAAAAPCTSPLSVAVLPDGAHSLAVTATDTVGNTSAPGTRAFALDRVAPVLRFTKKPKKKTKTKKAKFTITGSETLAKLECKLDKKAFKPCSATPSFKVKKGKHKLRVRATDAAGNVSRVIVHSWNYKKKRR